MDSEKRTSNFSQEEVNLLVQLVKKYKEVIECKRSDAVTWRQKEEAWQNLAAEFNAMNSKENRTVKALKGKWENLKKNTKKRYALEREEVFKTGGGKGILPKISTQDEEIKELIGVAVTGLENKFDSDNMEVACEIELDSVLNDHHYFEIDVTEPGPSTSSAPQPSIDKDVRETIAPLIMPVEAVPSTSTATKQTPGENWRSWTPTTLKRPVSRALSTTQETPKAGKRTKLTEDCRQKVKALSEAKLELVRAQKACLEDEKRRAEEIHQLKLQHMDELHRLEVKKKQLEIELLKKQLQ